MPIRLVYEPERAYLHAFLEGAVTETEFQAALEAIVSSTDHPPNVPTLWDFTAATLATWAPDAPRRFADLRRRYPQRGPSRVALLAVSDLAFGLLRMHEAYADDMSFEERIFRTPAEAVAWLTDDDPTSAR